MDTAGFMHQTFGEESGLSPGLTRQRMEVVLVSWWYLGLAMDVAWLQWGYREKPPWAGLGRGAGTWGPPGMGGFVWALKVPPLNHAAFSSHMYFLGGVPCPLLSHFQMPKILKNAIRIFFFMESRKTEVVSRSGFLLLFFPSVTQVTGAMSSV